MTEQERSTPGISPEEMKVIVLFREFSKLIERGRFGDNSLNITTRDGDSQQTVSIIADYLEGTVGCFGSPDMICEIRVALPGEGNERFRLGSLFGGGQAIDGDGKTLRNFNGEDMERLEQVLASAKLPDTKLEYFRYGNTVIPLLQPLCTGF